MMPPEPPADVQQDLARWRELAELLAQLRDPVFRLRDNAEKIALKAESLLDQPELRSVLNAHSNEIKNLLQSYSAQVADFSVQVDENVKSIVQSNNQLLTQLCKYLNTIAAANKPPQTPLWPWLIAAASPFLVLFALYVAPPPALSPQQQQVLDVLHKHLVKPKQP